MVRPSTISVTHKRARGRSPLAVAYRQRVAMGTYLMHQQAPPPQGHQLPFECALLLALLVLRAEKPRFVGRASRASSNHGSPETPLQFHLQDHRVYDRP